MLDLVFRDALLQDVSDEVEAPVIFGLRHEDVAAAQQGYIALQHFLVAEEPDRWLA
jgi:hypothetical protein